MTHKNIGDLQHYPHKNSQTQKYSFFLKSPKLSKFKNVYI